MNRFVCWFSCGAASAVAAYLTVKKHPESAHIVYCDLSSTEHPDNQRFLQDVQFWIGRPIERIRSIKYANIDDVFERTRYMAGIAGARCTTELKKLPRETFQLPTDTHIFGYTADEVRRIERFEKQNPSLHVEWILQEAGITKDACYRILEDAGIRLPIMYSLGFDHNNCLGCVKATSPGYWQKIRRLFPEVFQRRAAQSRLLGVRLTRLHGQRIFLDELPLDAGLDEPDGDIDCGPVCQTPSEDLS